MDCAIAQVVSYQLPTVAIQVQFQVSLCGISGEQSFVGVGFVECSGFPCQFSFHQIHHNLLSSGADPVGQSVSDALRASGLNLTSHPLQNLKKRNRIDHTCFLHQLGMLDRHLSMSLIFEIDSLARTVHKRITFSERSHQEVKYALSSPELLV
jgi:hypothetical protein